MQPETRKPNRLASEASPYLLQHAHNPVDWWPWCAEALAEAERRDVPILLSIGYSACHWCHVMERESFEDLAIARQMNEHFVCIKVDREERPDLDQIYQLALQLVGRSGGWPLTVFLTPSQRPFFGGTYFPPVDRHGMPGFPKILTAIADTYRERREEVATRSASLTLAIAEVSRGQTGGAAPSTPGPELLERATRPLLRRFDGAHGGFGGRPKFPSTMPLELLLRRGVLEGDGRAKDAARLALESMRKGGIWDHLGGGFHRYSVDERWLVPHFEKMLCDNALLLRAYADGYRVFGAPLFAETASEIAAYVAREMTDAGGGYYASQDADSEGEEGRFFVWEPADVRAALGEGQDAQIALAYYGVSEDGNVEDYGEATGKTVLHESRSLREAAAKVGLGVEEGARALARAKEAMFRVREGRAKPLRDEKILTSWSALMLGALADAGAALGAVEMVASAERALAFIAERLVKDGRVARFVKGDVVASPGFLDDHAYLANAALDVYEITGDPAKALLARSVADAMLASFCDDDGGFFFTPKDGEALITRSKDPYDNAVPSGTAMACRALLRLGTLVDAKYTRYAERELVRLAPSALADPFAHGQLLCELDRLVRGSVDVVLVGPRDDVRTRALADVVFRAWLPNRTVAWLDPGDPASRAACPALADGKAREGAPVAYVCRGRTCSLPVATRAELTLLLDAR